MFKFNNKYNKKQFTLKELIVIITIINILILLAGIKVVGSIDEANKTKIINNIKALEDASEEYILKNDEYPITDEYYVYEELLDTEIINREGNEYMPKEDENYYTFHDYSINENVIINDDLNNYLFEFSTESVLYISELNASPIDSIDGEVQVIINVLDKDSIVIEGYKGKELTLIAPKYDDMVFVDWNLPESIIIQSGNSSYSEIVIIVPIDNLFIYPAYDIYEHVLAINSDT